MNDETPLVREVYTDDGLTTPKTAKLDNEDLPIVISFDNTKSVDTTYYPVEVISDGEYYSVTSEGKAVYAQLSNSSTGALYTIKDGVKTSLGISLVGEDLLTPIINGLFDEYGAGGHYYYANGKIYEDENLQVPFMATVNGNQVQVGLSPDCTLTVGNFAFNPFEVDGVPVQTEDGSIPLATLIGLVNYGYDNIYWKTIEYGDELVYSNCKLHNTEYNPDTDDDDDADSDADADSDDDG